MAGVQISFEPPPNIDPTKATLAYGLGAIPRLRRELNSSDILVRQKALKALIDYLHDHEHIASSVDGGVVPSIRNLLDECDNSCRTMAVEVCYVYSMHSVGRIALLDNGVIIALGKLFSDNELIIRKLVYKTLEMTSEYWFGAEAIINANLVPDLFLKVQEECDELKEYILECLHYCLLLDVKDALEHQGMKILTALLTHEKNQIRAKAAKCIIDVAISYEGKEMAIKEETVPPLIEMLKSNDSTMKASAAGAIANIAIITHGKYAAINFGALPFLLPLVNDQNSEVRVNSIKALTCIAETPEGRRLLLDHIDIFKARMLDSLDAVAKHAKIAVDVITWKP